MMPQSQAARTQKMEQRGSEKERRTKQNEAKSEDLNKDKKWKIRNYMNQTREINLGNSKFTAAETLFQDNKKRIRFPTIICGNRKQ